LATIAALAGCGTASHPATDPQDAGSAEDGSSLADGGDATTNGEPPTMCLPGDVSHFLPTYTPPVGPNVGACTSIQLEALVTDCFAAFASSATCDPWENDPANAACLGCWSGAATASRWAPYLYVNSPGETDYLNVAGCVALADPGALSCARSLEAALECDFAACLQACPIPTTSTLAGLQMAQAALDECYDRADQGGCKTFVDEATACAAPLQDGGAASFCFLASRQTPSLLQFFTLACGGATRDAGSD
jgi:hypothetical protein